MERTSSVLDEISSKTVHKGEKVIYRGKRSKTLNKVKPFENINKNLHRFLEIWRSLKQKEVSPSHKVQGHL